MSACLDLILCSCASSCEMLCCTLTSISDEMLSDEILSDEMLSDEMLSDEYL